MSSTPFPEFDRVCIPAIGDHVLIDGWARQVVDVDHDDTLPEVTVAGHRHPVKSPTFTLVPPGYRNDFEMVSDGHYDGCVALFNLLARLTLPQAPVQGPVDLYRWPRVITCDR